MQVCPLVKPSVQILEVHLGVIPRTQWSAGAAETLCLYFLDRPTGRLTLLVRVGNTR